jgi:hypothetical protein
MKKESVMFLDLDGPLFSSRALMLPENNEYARETLTELKLNSIISYWYADPVAIAMLIELYRFKPYKIVISSSWANSDLHNEEQITNLLKRNGLGIPFHKNWKTISEDNNKVVQIKDWLKNTECTNYIVLDDYESGKEFQDQKLIIDNNIRKECITLVDFDNGILLSDFYKMKAILANWI